MTEAVWLPATDATGASGGCQVCSVADTEKRPSAGDAFEFVFATVVEVDA